MKFRKLTKLNELHFSDKSNMVMRKTDVMVPEHEGRMKIWEVGVQIAFKVNLS